MNIAQRVRMLAIGCVVVTAALVGLVVYWGYRRMVAEQQRTSLAQQVETEAKLLELALHEVSDDVLLLAALPSARAIAAAGERDSRADRDRLAGVFTTAMEGKDYYRQLRLIGLADGGMELVRIERRDSILRVPDEQLQRKGDRGYFLATAALPVGRLYHSAIDLNQEHGVLEVPHRPTLRTCTMIADESGKPFGMLAINLDFQLLVDELMRRENRHLELYITNESGDYLVHPAPDLTFGFDLGHPHRLQEERPELAEVVRGGETAGADGAADPAEAGTVALPGGGLMHFVKLRPFAGQPGRFLLLGLAGSYVDLPAESVALAWRAGLLTLALVCLAILIGYRLAMLLTRPLAELTATADHIVTVGEAVSLPVVREDEVGLLARAFASMLERLRGQQREVEEANTALRRANEDLEHFAHIASHDLREPARRLVGVADLLLLDMGADLPGNQARLLEMLQNESTRMLDQISDLRVFAGLAPGELRGARVSMGALVSRVLEEFDAAHAPELRSCQVDPMPELDVYPSLVKVLYNNLIENALTHADRARRSLSLTCERRDESWTFGVRNTGSSIPDEQARRLFAPFARLSRTGRGPGLGLAICRRIVERHGGRIWVESGAEYVHFRFTLSSTPHASDGQDPV